MLVMEKRFFNIAWLPKALGSDPQMSAVKINVIEEDGGRYHSGDNHFLCSSLCFEKGTIKGKTIKFPLDFQA